MEVEKHKSTNKNSAESFIFQDEIIFCLPHVTISHPNRHPSMNLLMQYLSDIYPN